MIASRILVKTMGSVLMGWGITDVIVKMVMKEDIVKQVRIEEICCTSARFNKL